jgi:predicted PurR-regulated permease PerM
VTTEQTVKKRLGDLLFYGIVIVLAFLVYLIFAPFLVPLAWAIVITVVSYPAYEQLARRWGPKTAALVSTVAITVILIAPTILVMAGFVRQGVEAVKAIQSWIAAGHFDWVNRVWDSFQQRFPEAGPADLSTTVNHYGEVVAGFVASRLGSILKNTAEFLFHLGVMLLAIFYLFIDGKAIVARLNEVLPFEGAHRERMIDEARELIFASVTSSLVAAAAHGILGGMAFAVTGIKAPIFWGVMMAFFSFVPVIGSAMIWAPAAVSLMVSGHLGRGIALLVICAVIVSAVDNVIRPWLISGRAEMGGLVIFISVLGGITAFGLLGIVLGPIIVATAASLLDVYAPSTPARATASSSSGAAIAADAGAGNVRGKAGGKK